MSLHLTSDERTAAVTVIRALLAAGWHTDAVDRLGDGETEYCMAGPDGQEIIARTLDGDIDLRMTGLTATQALLAVTGSGLVTPPVTAVDTPAPAEPPAPDTTPAGRLVAELHRIADDIAAGMPVGNRPDLHLGVLDSRTDLETVAAHWGSTINESGGGGTIPCTHHRIPLDGRPYGPSLTVRAQIQPDGRSEVDRLRARVAELEAQAGGAR